MNYEGSLSLCEEGGLIGEVVDKPRGSEGGADGDEAWRKRA